VVAKAKLGMMYYGGIGVDKDLEKSLRWFREAAEEGSSLAQFYLGIMYYNGEGVPEDYIRSYVWTSRAVSSGEKEAPGLLKELEKKMTPGQMEKARRLLK